MIESKQIGVFMLKLRKKAVVNSLLTGLILMSISGTSFAELPSSDAFMRDGKEKEESRMSKSAPSQMDDKEAARAAEEAAGITENSEDFKSRIQRIINDYNAGEIKHYPPGTQANPGYKEGAGWDPVPYVPAPAVNDSRESYPQPVNPEIWDATDAARRKVESHANNAFKHEDATFTFDWQGTDIAPAIYAVARAAGRDIVVNGDLQGKVYMSMHDVTCARALDYLARTFNFNWSIDEVTEAILISTDDKMLTSQVFRVHYVDKARLAEELKALGIEEDKIYANPETGTVSVTGTYYQIQSAARRIKALDAPVSQCLVVAQLIEIDHGNKLDLGVTYNLPTYSHTGTTSGITNDDSFRGNWLEKLTFSASATANEALSKGKVIARPMVLAMNGSEASVKFGDQVPIANTTATTASTEVSIDYKDVGTNLKIIPFIDEATGTITIKLNAEISNITQWRTVNGTQAPQISTRNAITNARLHSGQSFVIGGLMSAEELDNLSGIPGLMHLPILGSLFRFHSTSKSYAEVFIQITPYIVSDNLNPEEILRRVDTKQLMKDLEKKDK